MADFTLDTSGEVRGPRLIEMPDGNWRSHWTWPDLSPFEQGTAAPLLCAAWDTGLRRPDGSALGFSDLAPSTLEGMLRDCASFNLKIGDASHNRGIGAKFWESRQLGFTSFWSLHQADMRAHFPPLRLSLNDEGKIVSEEAA